MDTIQKEFCQGHFFFAYDIDAHCGYIRGACAKPGYAYGVWRTGFKTVRHKVRLFFALRSAARTAVFEWTYLLSSPLRI